ncbi:MAG: serine/threonine-protein kinase M1 [Alyxoria varia]|nr:MAG: serine/threonine-protein kinase M1 [Alyxoria varia]
MNGQNTLHDGYNSEKEAPPSTLAAQIVQHHSTARQRAQPSHTSTFRQLLDEIRADPTALEADTGSNYKLISVVAEAGLQSSPTPDPFDPVEQSTSQAVACFDVIEIALKRSPEALFFADPDQNPITSQLCFKLFSKILSSASRADFDKLRLEIERILFVIMRAGYSTPYMWSKIPILFQTLKAITRGRSELVPGRRMEILISCLDTMDSLRSSMLRSSNPSFDIPCPSAATIAMLVGHEQTPIAVAKGDSLHISGREHAVRVITVLTHTLTQISNDTRQSALTSENSGAIYLFASQLLGDLTAFMQNRVDRVEAHRSDGMQSDHLKSLSDLCYGALKETLPRSFLYKIGMCTAQCVSTYLSPEIGLGKESLFYLTKNIILLQSCCQRFDFIGLRVKAVLWTALRLVVDQAERFVDRGTDFRSAARSLLHILVPVKPPQESTTSNGIGSDPVKGLQSRRLRRLAKALGLQKKSDNGEVTPRPAKRVKLSSHHYQEQAENPSCSSLVDQLCTLLGNWRLKDLKFLPEAAPGLFSDMTDAQRIELLEVLALMPCTGVRQTEGSSSIEFAYSTSCPHCRATNIHASDSKRSSFWDETDRNCFYEILASLIHTRVVQSSKQLRCLSMVAIQRFACHASSSDHLDISISAIGQYCMQGLRSSVREIRIAAANALPMFLESDSVLDETLLRKNRIGVLEFLRTLSQSDNHRIHETVILALGYVALVCGDEELNLVLLQLVEFLGDPNPFICGMTNLELRRLAEISNMSLEELLRPFWRSIAIHIVKDLPEKPQKAQQLSELLDWDLNQLLIYTQSDTLPYLLLWGRTDGVHRIARAYQNETKSWSLCTQSGNLSKILALFITQDPEHIGANVMNSFIHYNQALDDEDVINLLKVDPIGVAFEILKAAADAQGDEHDRACRGFTEFSSIVERRGHSTRTSTTERRMTSLFFENHALGIMNQFSDSIDSASQSIAEKRRCVAGIQVMINLAQKDISVALPQIRACLQTALVNTQLCNEAFCSWTGLLEVVGDADLQNLIGPTFTAIVQRWAVFSSTTQQQVFDAVTRLLKERGTVIQDNVGSIPSMAEIPLLSKFETQISRLKNHMDVGQRLASFSRRCKDENAMVVLQAVRELRPYLEQNQSWIHTSASSEQPSPIIADVVRSLLDTCARFNDREVETAEFSTYCLGVIGCLDSNRVDIVREKHEMIILSNFISGGEALEFVSFLLEQVLVKAFHSVSNTRAQGFLAYAMQELLKFCGFSKESMHPYRNQGSQPSDSSHRWQQLSGTAKNTLTPFLSSHYVLRALSTRTHEQKKYPFHSATMNQGTWVREFVFDLLQRPKGDNAKMIFLILSRIIRGYDVSISNLLLPFAVANVIIGGTVSEGHEILQELLSVLKEPTAGKPREQVEQIRLCSENVFQVHDYLNRWLHEKKKAHALAKDRASRSIKSYSEWEEKSDIGQIETVEPILAGIPALCHAERAMECGSYARALLHWERNIREDREYYEGKGTQSPNEESLYQRLQDIYAHIDDPDGIEGVSAHLHILSADQQALEHKRAGRWAAAQSWYELELKENPANTQAQNNLLSCLLEAGQFNAVINQAGLFHQTVATNTPMMSMLAQAAWSAEEWEQLEKLVPRHTPTIYADFNVGTAATMVSLHHEDYDTFSNTIKNLRQSITKSMSASSAASIQASHDHLLKLHALYELELISGHGDATVRVTDRSKCHSMLDKRLDILGGSLPDKEYLLGIRRAAMRLCDPSSDRTNVASLWVSTAKLARKRGHMGKAYDAVMHATKLGDESAKIEHARLLWNEGEHRKAIKHLEGAILANTFQASGEINASAVGSHSTTMNPTNTSTSGKQKQNVLLARAHLLLAKWLDRAGQTQSDVIMDKYRQATTAFTRWEKGSYYLGRFYNKLLESERSLPPARQSMRYLNGEMGKLVIENYLRSLIFGCKYIFQSLPKLLTLWLELGEQVMKPMSREVPDDVRTRAMDSRPKIMEITNKQIKKYSEKIIPYVFYTALSQMISRVGHPNSDVSELLTAILVKVATAHPQQALWSLLAIIKAQSHDRVKRGTNILNKLKDRGKTVRNEGMSHDLRSLVAQGQKLSDELVNACETPIHGKPTHVSLAKELGFKHKVAPCPLVVPLEKTLMATLPNATSSSQMKGHRPFPASREAVTISSFEDDVLVLSSLQRPRKITVRGSDGLNYGLLCKPNDDLRKDQRLMEFNAMINRSLKKDAESSKRRLYTKTYAVTPLNEACGVIEWVDGLKPMRDIIIGLYRTAGIQVDYRLLRDLLNEASADPADGWKIFTETILPMYPPILHTWFTDLFPAPDAWFAARTRYARSSAVTSMTGYALGLGDRHGENVLLEAPSPPSSAPIPSTTGIPPATANDTPLSTSTSPAHGGGGVFHVDFNCLFDKGLTFEKPELVPFRLTHNMVDAFGATGCEGSFRRCAELCAAVMRANEDALLTILETFVYDPTADFVVAGAVRGGPAKKVRVKGVPETPREVLESVRGKVGGYLQGESLRLSVQGHVDALVRQSVDPGRLCRMYIGWCAFL